MCVKRETRYNRRCRLKAKGEKKGDCEEECLDTAELHNSEEELEPEENVTRLSPIRPPGYLQPHLPPKVFTDSQLSEMMEGMLAEEFLSTLTSRMGSSKFQVPTSLGGNIDMSLLTNVLGGAEPNIITTSFGDVNMIIISESSILSPTDLKVEEEI